MHGLATKEGCRTRSKSRNLKYAMGVRSTGFTTLHNITKIKYENAPIAMIFAPFYSDVHVQ
jgi:hypothetical protein